MKLNLWVLVSLPLVSCGNVASDREPQPNPQAGSCQGGLDLDGDRFADLVVPENPVWDEGAPTWRANVYRGGPASYESPIEFLWKEGWGANLIAYSLGDARNLGITDVVFYPHQTGAAQPTCEAQQVLRAEDGVLVLHPLSAGCPAPSSTTSTPFGDVTGDGEDEILSWKQQGEQVTIDLVTQDGTVLASTSESSDVERGYIGVGDVTGDGVTDALGFDLIDDVIDLVLIPGAPGGLGVPEPYASLALASGLLATAALLGDVNGDGALDFQLNSVKTPVAPEIQRYVALSINGTHELSLVEHVGGDSGSLLPAGDIDCDGRDDLVAKFFDADLGPSQTRLRVYHGTDSGLRAAGSLAIPIGVNGTDILPVFAPFYTRTWLAQPAD